MVSEGGEYRVHYLNSDRGPGIKQNIAFGLCYARLRFRRGLSHEEAYAGCKHHLE